MKKYEEYKKEYGEVIFEGRKYALKEEPYMDQYELRGWEMTEYNANALDEMGDLYYITWDTTTEFDKKLEEEELQFIDESEACDWENPITVEKRMGW